MSKRFKSHRKHNRFVIKILVFIILVLLVVQVTFNTLYHKLTSNLSEIEVINILLNNTNDDFKKIFSGDGINFIVNYTLGLDLNNVKKNSDSSEKVLPTMNETEVVTYDEPLVYIYNTHQTEEYRAVNTNDYNITPTVMHASLILQNRLSNVGIKSIVETNNIKELLDINGWNYKNSYKASKMLATDALERNPSIKYVIDLHRDSISENIGKINIDGKDYAKIMLVLGKGHDGYERNLELANRINNYLKEFNENISRGIDIKINSGIYNQDLSPNAVLIEIGGPYNDINSVSNSIEVLADVYKRVILEDEKKAET